MIKGHNLLYLSFYQNLSSKSVRKIDQYHIGCVILVEMFHQRFNLVDIGTYHSVITDNLACDILQLGRPWLIFFEALAIGLATTKTGYFTIRKFISEQTPRPNFVAKLCQSATIILQPEQFEGPKQGDEVKYPQTLLENLTQGIKLTKSRRKKFWNQWYPRKSPNTPFAKIPFQVTKRPKKLKNV